MHNAGPGRAVLLLGIATFAASASLRATDPLLARLAIEFDTTPGRAAAATTAFFLAYGLLQVAHGPVGDRFGKFRVVSVHAGLAACATLLCALAPTLEALTVTRFIAGLFVGAVIPLSLAWIGDVVPYAGRQALIARFLIASLGGGALGLASGGWFAEHLSWRWSFVLIATLFATASILLAWELHHNPLHRRLPSAAPQKRANPFELLRDRWVRILIGSVFLEAMLVFGSMGFIPLHLHRVHGIDLAASGMLVTLTALGGLTYALSAARLVQRFGERGLVRLGGIGVAVALAALALAPLLAVAVVALFATGLCLFMLHGTLQVHATQMAPEARGAGVSTFAFFLFAGQSIGTWLCSLVVDAWGTAPIFVVSALGVWVLSVYFRRQLERHAQTSP